MFKPFIDIKLPELNLKLFKIKIKLQLYDKIKTQLNCINEVLSHLL